jgi:hypothetical protein
MPPSPMVRTSSSSSVRTGRRATKTSSPRMESTSLWRARRTMCPLRRSRQRSPLFVRFSDDDDDDDDNDDDIASKGTSDASGSSGGGKEDVNDEEGDDTDSSGDDSEADVSPPSTDESGNPNC